MRGIEGGRIPSCRYSDALLSNLWRWLCSPASRLASSGLHRTVTGLLRKTLAQLVADLRLTPALLLCPESMAAPDTELL